MKNNELNKFKCSYRSCNRTLMREGTRAFRCTMCGHGNMRVVEPRAYCENCGDPICDNVDLRPDRRSKEGYYVICGNCTMAKVLGIQDIEGELHTDFKDVEDADEKVAYFNTKAKEAEKLNISPAKIKVKSFGDRLKEIRKKLGLTQTQLAEYFNIKAKSTILRYEKNERKLPENVKEWIQSAESMFRHFKRKEGKEKAIERLSNINDPKKAVLLQKRANPLGKSCQF